MRRKSSPRPTSSAATGIGLAACARKCDWRAGEYVETPSDGAICDGNLVTGFAWPAHPQFLALFLEVLGTRISL
jgi:protease I